MLLLWVGFIAFVCMLLALDLGVFNKTEHAPSVKEALAFTAMTVALAVAFGGFIYEGYANHWAGLGTVIDAVDSQYNGGRLAAVKFFTGYIVEMSLSMDNVFVIALIFEHLKVPKTLQHRVLFWGVLGALVMRGVMIGGGAALVARYHFVFYIFGAFLIITAIKMLFAKGESESPEETGIVRWLNKHFRVAKTFHGRHFVITESGRKVITPLFVALVLVESTDLLFAVDSIPAIFAITTDAFLVFTSNVFAILCLRSLYFGLAGMIEKFRYLKLSLALILALVGTKMLFADWLTEHVGEKQNFIMLGVVAGILALGALASSVITPARHHKTKP
jgi:tellurite resistance protein TerC